MVLDSTSLRSTWNSLCVSLFLQSVFEQKMKSVCFNIPVIFCSILKLICFDMSVVLSSFFFKLLLLTIVPPGTVFACLSSYKVYLNKKLICFDIPIISSSILNIICFGMSVVLSSIFFKSAFTNLCSTFVCLSSYKVYFHKR